MRLRLLGQGLVSAVLIWLAWRAFAAVPALLTPADAELLGLLPDYCSSLRNDCLRVCRARYRGALAVFLALVHGLWVWRTRDLGSAAGRGAQLVHTTVVCGMVVVGMVVWVQSARWVTLLGVPYCLTAWEWAWGLQPAGQFEMMYNRTQ